jgi:hypothetical protein
MNLRRARYPLCMDCVNLDRETWDFSSPNKHICREDGREHWIGEPATDCQHFVCGPDSRIAAFASGY